MCMILTAYHVDASETLNTACTFQAPPDLVIGADTIVTQNDVIFEKPRDKNHAFEMLRT